MQVLKTAIMATIFGLLQTGCANVTINVTFPEEKVQERITRIEDYVESGQAPEHEDGDAGRRTKPGAWAPRLLDSLSHPADVYAAGANDLTEEEAVIANRRKARVHNILEWKNRGVIGEGNEGLLVIRHARQLSVKDRAAIKRLVQTENHDRELLFRLIAREDATDDILKIRKKFAADRRKRAKKGHWIQEEDDTWVQR